MPRTTSPSRVEPRLSGPEAVAVAPLTPVELRPLSRAALTAMATAGYELAELERLFAKTADNVVGLVLEHERNFYEWTHYPAGDVQDAETGAQYYYHAHPKEERPGEHGHFHTFLRPKGMPKGMKPALVRGYVPPRAANDALSHLVAVAMSDKGQAIELFTTNRWVTGETWYQAGDVAAMLDRFAVGETTSPRALDRWITAMLGLYRPQIAALVEARDATVMGWRRRRRGKVHVFEDRRLEVTSALEIDVAAQRDAIATALRVLA